MSLVPYIQYNERVVGENSPLGYQDVENRPLKYVMLQSGLDDTQDFLGFASGSAGDGVPEGSVLGRVGDIYADRANTSGVIWVKSSGNNTNLGWRSVFWGTGTPGTIPKFGASGSLVDSIITEAAGAITVTGDETVTGIVKIGPAIDQVLLGTGLLQVGGFAAFTDSVRVIRYGNFPVFAGYRANGTLGTETALLN